MPKYAAQALKMLENAGFEAWCVGGCVRDSIRGAQVHDWDICTSALPEQTLAVFDGLRTIPTGLKHGTVTVIIDGEQVEITTYRTDGDYLDHRRPEKRAVRARHQKRPRAARFHDKRDVPEPARRAFRPIRRRGGHSARCAEVRRRPEKSASTRTLCAYCGRCDSRRKRASRSRKTRRAPLWRCVVCWTAFRRSAFPPS